MTLLGVPLDVELALVARHVEVFDDLRSSRYSNVLDDVLEDQDVLGDNACGFAKSLTSLSVVFHA